MEDILNSLARESQALKLRYQGCKKEKATVMQYLDQGEDRVDALKKKKQELTKELADVTAENNVLRERVTERKKHLAALKKEVATTANNVSHLQKSLHLKPESFLPPTHDS